MSCAAVFSQIHVESIVFFVQTQLVHTRCQFVVVVLSLASADDLTDTRYQTVNRCHGLAVIVQFHIERFDILRIVRNKYRTFVHLLSQITLMLGLQIASPGHFVFEFVVVLRQNIDGFCVSYTGKFRIYHVVQTV